MRELAEPPAYRPFDRPEGELVPRDVGALVGGTFTLYRANFAPLITISLLAHIPLLISAVTPISVAWVLWLVSLLGYLLAYSAIVFATAQRHVEPEINLERCLGRTWGEFSPLIGAYLILSLGLAASAMLMFLIIGIPLFFFILVRWFFLAPAIMIEGRGPIAALRRSSSLVEGSWWRVFGIGLVFMLVIVGLAVVGSLPGGLIGLGNSVAGGLGSVLINSLVFPIAPVGAALVYLDLRHRKDDYTLGDLALEIGHGGPRSDI